MVASEPKSSPANPIEALRSLEKRLRECLAFVQRMKLEEPLATDKDASHNRALQISDQQVELVYQAVLGFARARTGKQPNSMTLPNPHLFLHDKRREAGPEPRWWTAAEQTYVWYLEWVQTATLYVHSIDEPRPNYQVHVAGDAIMGDVFKNIRDSTIIKESTVQDSFNSLRQQGNPEAADLLLRIGEIIARSNDVVAASLYEKLAEEAKKQKPDKGVLKSCWDGMVAIVPPVANLASAAVKVFELST